MKKTLWLLLLFGFMVACADEPDPTPTPTPDIPTETPTVTVEPFPTATYTPTPTPTPTPTSIEVGFQTLDETGQILIDQVITPVEGWLVLYEATGERPLASARISPNRAIPLQLTINPFEATESLILRLYADEGQADVFDDDPPLLLNGEPVEVTFDVDFAFTTPEIRITDQTITETENLVRVEQVIAVADSWLAIHDYANQEIGTMLGHAFVEVGQTNDLVIPVNWREGGRGLVAVLYEDNGRSRSFGLDTDQPIEVNNVPVMAEFTANLPYDIYILDQPIVNNEVIVEQIIVNEPSWVVLHPDVDGEVGLIVGFTHLEAGVNHSVVITLINNAQTTSPMYIKLHEDVAEPNVFDFPGDDVPVTQNGRQLAPVPFSTTPGNYLITRDQPIPNDQVTVPLAVLAQPAWVVVYTEENGELGEIVGQTAVLAGINRDISIAITGQISGTLYAVLHVDDGELGLFEPEEDDVPLQRNRAIINAPFTILSTTEES